MTLEESLIENLLSEYKLRGKNLQAILDNPLFKDLPLDKKVLFINKYKKDLASNPSFNWSSVGTHALQGGFSGSLVGASLALSGIPMGKPFNPYLVGIGALLGSLGSGLKDHLYEKKIYNSDIETSKNLDNAIKTLISRSINTTSKPSEEPLRVKLINKMLDPSNADKYYTGYTQAAEYDRARKGN